MIENDIINWLEISENMKYIDIYDKQSRVKFFKLIHTMMDFKTFGSFWYLLLKLVYFLQIMMLAINGISQTSDNVITLLKYISNILLINEYFSNESAYSLVILVLSILTLIIIFIYIYIQISINLGKFYIHLPVSLLNYFNQILIDYLIGPIIMVALLSTKCDNNNEHIILHKKCFSDPIHVVIMLFAMINLIFYIGYNYLLSVYYNEIGAINKNKLAARINCSYEFFIFTNKCIIFLMTYFHEYYIPNNKYMLMIIQIFICLSYTFFCIYCYQEVLYYNTIIDILHLYGNAFIAWFSFCLIIRELLKFKEISVLLIVGFIIIAIILYLLEDDRRDFLLTDFNIFQANSIKKIEIFIQQLYNLISVNSIRNKTILVGMIEKFENYFQQNYELYTKYTKLHTDEIVNKKITNKLELKILSIVYIVYEYHLNQEKFTNDILVILSYFLMNKFKKSTLALRFCSLISVKAHKYLYLKYVLMEEIKDFLVFKITKATDKDTMSHVQISSMILYYIYSDLFKIKIYDATCSQIDYFDLLMNHDTDTKVTKNFLKIGDEILLLRKKIMKLWEKIFALNPFCEDCQEHYRTYLEGVLQDDELYKTEEKRIGLIRKSKMSVKTNIYFGLFLKDQSCVLLLDGYNNMGKILYATPNIENIFDYKTTELINGNMNTLLPKPIAEIHNELIENSIKFSRLEKIFKNPLETSIKGKRNGLFNVSNYIKSVPNFKFGLIYFCYLKKLSTNTFNIMLDKNLSITCFTDLFKEGSNSLIVQFFGFKPPLTNRNICVFIPEILKQIKYENNSYLFIKNEIDLEGNFYPITNINEVESKVNLILEKIKITGYLKMDEEGDNQDTFKEYDELMFMIRKRYTKGTKIFYKIKTKIFLKKHIIHLFQMSNDLIKYNIKDTLENNYNDEYNTANNNQENKEEKQKKNEEKKELNLIQLENKKIDGDADKFKENEKEESTSKNSDKINKKNKKGNTIKKSDNNNRKTPEGKKSENNEEQKDEKDSLQEKKSVNMDISTYNKLKAHVIAGKEVLWMGIMKYVGLSFGILSLLFSYLFYLSQISELKDLNEYCHQNLLFNHSKIDFACIFITAKNLYYTKFNLINENSCYGQNICSKFFLGMLSSCLIDLEENIQNTSYFNEDFIKILQESIQVNLTMYLTSDKEVFNITKKNLFMLILSMAFDYTSNIENYFNNFNTIYDIMNINFGANSLFLFNDKTLVGFDEENKKKNLDESLSNSNNYSFIIELCILIIFSGIFGILVFQVNKIELEYIQALIKFNSKPFEAYLGHLLKIKESFNEPLGDKDYGEKKEDQNNESLVYEEDSNNLIDGRKISKIKEQKNKDSIDNGELIVEENNQTTSKSKKDKEKDPDKNSRFNEDKKRKKEKDKKKGRSANMKQLKIIAMSKYFKQMNIIFIVKIFIVFLLGFSFFIVLIIMEKYYKNILLDLDEIISEISGVYKDGFNNLMLLKNITQTEIEYQIEKAKAEYYFNLGRKTYNINGIIYTKENISLYNVAIDNPSNLKLSNLKLGNSLMIILNDDTIKQDIKNKLNELYNGNTCKILFLENGYNINDTYVQNDYDNCMTFWSAILQKGMEQSITQMIIERNSVEDELSALYRKDKNITDIMDINSSFRRFEFFLIFYFLKSFYETNKIFDEIKETKIDDINSIYLIITIVYIIITFFLIIIVRYIIKNSRKVFNSFLNFIVILPAKFLVYDSYFLEEVLKLEEKLY